MVKVGDIVYIVQRPTLMPDGAKRWIIQINTGTWGMSDIQIVDGKKVLGPFKASKIQPLKESDPIFDAPFAVCIEFISPINGLVFQAWWPSNLLLIEDSGSHRKSVIREKRSW
jgi:hypothetical protein